MIERDGGTGSQSSVSSLTWKGCQVASARVGRGRDGHVVDADRADGIQLVELKHSAHRPARHGHVGLVHPPAAACRPSEDRVIVRLGVWKRLAKVVKEEEPTAAPPAPRSPEHRTDSETSSASNGSTSIARPVSSRDLPRDISIAEDE